MKHMEALKGMHESFYNFPWDNKVAYAEYLAQSYYYINQSTRLLAFAAGYTNDAEKRVFKRFTQHLREEMNHEVLCIRDLEALGHTMEEFSEMAETQSFYESQYYRIQKQGPISLLGYVYALETAACLVGPRIIQDKLIGLYPDAAMKFLKLHAEEDPDHIEQAKKSIESLDGSAREIINQNIYITSVLFSGVLSAVEKRAMRVKSRNVVAFNLPYNEAFEI